MSRWRRIYNDMVNDPAVLRMSGAEYRAKFIACLNGEENEFSRWMGPLCSGRPSIQRWAEIRAGIFKRDDYTCQYCGARGGKLECDHVTPLSRGGSNDDGNLVTACKPCNRSKRAKTPEEWLGGAQ
jgi:5-methylcytosine-specific restriction endonuclease McrA